MDWNPMHSPVSQAIVSHVGAVAAGALIPALLGNPQVIAGMVPGQFHDLAIALVTLITGWLAKTSYSTALNTPVPVVTK